MAIKHGISLSLSFTRHKSHSSALPVQQEVRHFLARSTLLLLFRDFNRVRWMAAYSVVVDEERDIARQGQIHVPFLHQSPDELYD